MKYCKLFLIPLLFLLSKEIGSFSKSDASERPKNIQKEQYASQVSMRALYDPFTLLVPSRLDVIAKYIYGYLRELRANTGFGLEIYMEHLRVINGFHEGYPKKDCIEDFVNAYHTVLDSVKLNGFSERISTVPLDKCGNLCNGAHRLAACLLYKQMISAVWYGAPVVAMRFDAYSLASKGLKERYLDTMALHYCLLKPNVHIALIFPSAGDSKLNEVRSYFSKYGDIVYEKKFKLSKNGPFNLIKLLYEDDHWIGDWNTKFAGIRKKMSSCFPKNSENYSIHAFLVEMDNIKSMDECKEKIRSLYLLGKHSIHATDTHEQAILLAQSIYSANSIHFLEHAEPNQLKRFDELLPKYKKWLTEAAVDMNCFCVDSSSVLSAYGIRDCSDLDYLHHGYHNIKSAEPLIQGHNSYANHYAVKKDEIIFNPAYHFYYKGLKFASLETVKIMKEKRNERKDRLDVALITEFLNRK